MSSGVWRRGRGQACGPNTTALSCRAKRQRACRRGTRTVLSPRKDDVFFLKEARRSLTALLHVSSDVQWKCLVSWRRPRPPPPPLGLASGTEPINHAASSLCPRAQISCARLWSLRIYMFSPSICQFPYPTVPTEPSPCLLPTLHSFLCFLPFLDLPSLLFPPHFPLHFSFGTRHSGPELCGRVLSLPFSRVNFQPS